MSKCWYCNEEITSAGNPKHLGICNKCYAEMFKEGDDFISELTNKITDLEAKLAEMQNEKDELISKYRYWKGECAELKQQLAEKENTITTLIEDSKTSKELLKKEIEELKAQRHIYLTRSVDECNKITMLELELQHKDQDKISFCIEQLEKVKLFNRQRAYNYMPLTNYIDNQIKQLKEGK